MRLLFISDLHLSEQRPDLTRALLNFLREDAAHCDQLYLLGDIFDAWIGDDFAQPSFLPLIKAFNQLSASGTRIFFQHGNRDFLLGKNFANQISATLLPEQVVIDLPDNQKALIMHGDQLCIDDTEYHAFRKMVRNPTWQSEFLAKPIEERLAIASQLRAASKEKTAEKALDIMDVNAQSVQKVMNDTDCNLLIHGHTHRPAIHKHQRTNSTGTRIVLGDWDQNLWYLECSESGCDLHHRSIE
ncbi:MAG: UDP-2,3-diacylglucosamine diphosphatase [Pontibacterium sp.]